MSAKRTYILRYQKGNPLEPGRPGAIAGLCRRRGTQSTRPQKFFLQVCVVPLFFQNETDLQRLRSEFVTAPLCRRRGWLPCLWPGFMCRTESTQNVYLQGPILEEPNNTPPADMRRLTTAVEEAPETPQRITIEFITGLMNRPQRR
ncbi:hypothetical protein B0H12DRAFT_235332 [Mycena haematopus]|nr:hypothetical protein B0H12DRAFT_235332 [Mycena haematopus]